MLHPCLCFWCKIHALFVDCSCALHELIEGILRNKKEPSFAASLAISIARWVNARFKTSHPQLSVSGCFLHQKPYVTFKRGTGEVATCELGDLLVVCHDVIDGQDCYNASLFQLKKGAADQTVDKTQYELYAKWPEFRLAHNYEGLGRKSYDLQPKTWTPGAAYMFIDKCDYDDSSCYVVAVPKQGLKCGTVPFEIFMETFLLWQSGRAIANEKDKNQDKWSELIWDVVRLLEKCPLRCKGVKKDAGQKRIAGNALHFMRVDDDPGMPIEERNLQCGEGDRKVNEEGPYHGFAFVYIDFAPHTDRRHD